MVERRNVKGQGDSLSSNFFLLLVMESLTNQLPNPDAKLKSLSSFWSSCHCLFFLFQAPSAFCPYLSFQPCVPHCGVFQVYLRSRRCLRTGRWSAPAASHPAKWPAPSQSQMPGASPVLPPVVIRELSSTHHPWSWPFQDPSSAPALRRVWWAPQHHPALGACLDPWALCVPVAPMALGVCTAMGGHILPMDPEVMVWGAADHVRCVMNKEQWATTQSRGRCSWSVNCASPKIACPWNSQANNLI